MKIEKFLEKISQDERVESITYDKRWGYRVVLKDCYGILEEERKNLFIKNNAYINCTQASVRTCLRSNTQQGIRYYLNQVANYSKEWIENLNKTYTIKGLERYIDGVKRTLEMTSSEIQAAKQKKNNLEDSLKLAQEFQKELKEDDNDGTAEQL